LDWESRFAKDVEYVKGISLWMDVKVLLLTVKKVFAHSDIAEDTNVAEGNFAKIRSAQLEEKMEN
jgi:lipopolysaccharide/colanic/teichoic acid biosynthesis glycosyltransferase